MSDRRAGVDHYLVPGVKKIAVVRANGLGDFVFALPALDALRLAYPDAEIVLFGKAWHAAFLENRQGPVDRVVVTPVSRGVNEDPGVPEDAGGLDRFFAVQQRERFDLAIQIHGGGRYSNPFTLRLGARLTIGLKTPDAVPLDRWIPYVYFQSEIIRYLEVVGLAGACSPHLEPRLAVSDADVIEAAKVVPGDGQPLVALHPGAGDGRRRWPPEKFAQIGDALFGAGARVLVTGSAPEYDLAESVVRSMSAPSGRDQDLVDRTGCVVPGLNLAGKLSLGGLAGLLSRCAVVVSNDSGPLHLAQAVGASTVGIFWCFNLINAGPATRLRHRPVVSWELECPVCGRNCTRDKCDHRASFVAEIPIEPVAASALDLLQRAVSATEHPRLPLLTPAGLRNHDR